MNKPAVHLIIAPFTSEIPAPIYFRTAQIPASATYPTHRHPWGEFVYSFSGVMEIKLSDKHFIAPPHYGVWLPPNAEHWALNRQEACHCSLYIAEPLCEQLPESACALTITPLIRALLDELRASPPALAQTEEDSRLLYVLLDRLNKTSREGSYLPGSNDPILSPILERLEQNPADDRSLGDWARLVNATERTLLRRCQRDLGMSLAQWKQRLKVMRSLELLRHGATVEAIAFDLGYNSSSSFISMFRKLTGETPHEYRREKLS
ncbi:helix-turn-helix transcriptional regulator [Pseudomonas gingeri]|uniref:AraC family transcriptional regulator n=1 Tax=Pseudomonas gingeri TaxID=117681 RepID=UPI0015A1D289|nr:helix-turn-helix transcriptional regulator [Pseudomonas gingeri]NWD67072.1 helix-turn-helix transcriptional regulator [Pseudomonas gingeri]